MRFNVAKFVGGPLDGVCWPTVVNPDKVAVTCHPREDGRVSVHLYECDQEDAYEDGTFQYRLVPALLPEVHVEELLHDLGADARIVAAEAEADRLRNVCHALEMENRELRDIISTPRTALFADGRQPTTNERHLLNLLDWRTKEAAEAAAEAARLEQENRELRDGLTDLESVRRLCHALQVENHRLREQTVPQTDRERHLASLLDARTREVAQLQALLVEREQEG